MVRLAAKASGTTAHRELRLRKLTRKKFVQWLIGELGGQWQLGWGRSRGFEGYRVVNPSAYRDLPNAPLAKCRWYPIQAKQKNQVGRPDIDLFEAVMLREDCDKGFLVGFNFSTDALREINAFFKRTRKVIVALTVREILEEEIAMKMG